MLPFNDPTPEVQYRHHQVHRDFVASQRRFSVRGMRQILGNTVIAIGTTIHGMARSACQEAAESRAHVRSIDRMTPHTS